MCARALHEHCRAEYAAGAIAEPGVWCQHDFGGDVSEANKGYLYLVIHEFPPV